MHYGNFRKEEEEREKEGIVKEIMAKNFPVLTETLIYTSKKLDKLQIE